MQVGKRLRIRRIFHPPQRSVILPMDHALYYGPVPGLEHPAGLVEQAAQLGVDGLLVTPGMLDDIAPYTGAMALILRLDGTVSRHGACLEETRLITSVAEAAALGVEWVVINVYTGTKNEAASLEKMGRVAEACRRHGMVLVGEMIPAPLLPAHYGRSGPELSVEERAEHIATAARIGVEIGADLIKTVYSGSVETFREVITQVPRPVFVAGGIKAANEAVFMDRVAEVLEAGAAGICAGRNVWQSQNMEVVMRRLLEMVHGAAMES